MKCYSIEKLSEIIEKAFEQHYRQTSDQPTDFQSAMLRDKESDYVWERDGEPVVDAIMNAAEIPEEAASDIQKVLERKFYDFDAVKMGEETEFSADSHYEEKGANDAEWQAEWRQFEHSLKTEARFFSRSASCMLESVFSGIHTMQTWEGRPLVVEAGPGTDLTEMFRARSFQLNENLQIALARPDTQLGSPPSAHAKAGRMNAHGISVFYGANNPKVALAEVRPPVGCQVAIARFEILRPLRLLDLTALSKVVEEGSIFDSSYIDRLEKLVFMRDLNQLLIVPVMPDNEAFEYLATQAIADYLSTELQPPLDGIIFPSVQVARGGLNFVLFQKASRVEEIESPKGTQVEVRLGYMSEDGWERDYDVYEEVPPTQNELKQNETEGRGTSDNTVFDLYPSAFISVEDYDPRPSTLKIDLNSVEVHVVDSVEFGTSNFKVRRHRFKKTKPEF